MSFYDDASWLLIPSGIEEDIVFAQKPISGLGDLTFTRASDATYTDASGVVRRSPYNLVTWSEMFSDVAWSKIAAGTGVAPSITANTSTSPTGTLTADRVQFNCTGTTFSDRSILFQTITSAVVGRSYVFTIYIKANAPSEVGKQLRFNVDNGTNPAQVITINADWTRYTFAAIATSTSINALLETRGTVTTNTTADVLLWGAQLVEGTSALDYFPTTNRQDVPRIDFRNADGTLSSCGRLLLEPQRTNSIRNSSMVGAVAGTPGTLPTNWTQFFGNGLTRTVVGTGTENGLPYIDVRFNGTVTTISTEISTETSSAISVSNGQIWSNSGFIKIISAPLPPNSYSLKSYYWNGGSYVSESTTPFTPTTTLARYSAAHTVPAGTITHISQSIRMNLTNGAAYDFTIRIAAPQMELGAYATTWVPTTTAAVTRLADAFTRNNIYTNGLISSAGGTWIVDLSNNLSLTRDAASTSLSISTLSGDVFAGANSFEIRGAIGNRFEIAKRIGGTATNLFTTTTSNVKIAIKWNGTTADVFVNGVKQVSATAFTTTVMEFLKSFGTDVPKYINQSFLAATPLSDAECIQLTTL